MTERFLIEVRAAFIRHATGSQRIGINSYVGMLADQGQEVTEADLVGLFLAGVAQAMCIEVDRAKPETAFRRAAQAVNWPNDKNATPEDLDRLEAVHRARELAATR